MTPMGQGRGATRSTTLRPNPSSADLNKPARGIHTGQAAATRTQDTRKRGRRRAGSFGSEFFQAAEEGRFPPGRRTKAANQWVFGCSIAGFHPSSLASSPTRRLLAFARPGANRFHTAVLATPEDDDDGCAGAEGSPAGALRTRDGHRPGDGVRTRNAARQLYIRGEAWRE